MIQITNMHFAYPEDDFRLRIPSLLIEAQEKVAIVGPSGFGKTTLLNLFAGILSPDAGEVSVKDSVVNRLSDQERRAFRIANIGFVFQDFKLIEYLKVEENILLPFRINKKLNLSSEIRSRVKSIANTLDIGDKLKKFPSKLSQGEQQRVAIARALINNPAIILADEPTGNLDPANKARIKKVLFDSSERFGATLVTVTHDHELLKGFDRVIDFQDYQKQEDEG